MNIFSKLFNIFSIRGYFGLLNATMECIQLNCPSSDRKMKYVLLWMSMLL